MMFNLIAQAGQNSGQAGNLGAFEPPSEAFGFEVSADSAAVGATSTLEKIISIGLGGVTIIAALYYLFVFVTAAFNWISSAGDSGKLEKARDSMINGLFGMLFIVAAYAIIGVIGSVMGIDILNAGTLIQELAPAVGE